MTRKHEVVLRGGHPKLDGKIIKVQIGTRGIIIPGIIKGQPGISQFKYRPTDQRIDGRQVWRIC